MKFTLLQLFSIVDNRNRLSTSMDDVYSILNTATGDDLFTHHLPVAMRYIKEVQPDWYIKASQQLLDIKEKIGDDFQNLVSYISKVHPTDCYEVTEMTIDQKKGFGGYMLNNSLLLKRQ